MSNEFILFLNTHGSGSRIAHFMNLDRSSNFLLKYGICRFFFTIYW